MRPATGAVEWWLASGVNVALFQRILDAFAKAVGAGRRASIVLVIDNAGWHISDKLKAPDGVTLCFLPPYSPELQPAERLWPLTDEAIANRPFESLEQLSEALAHRCRALAEQATVITGHTHFHWWPAE